jgi:hypothetical protein
MNNESLYALWIVWSIARTYPIIAAAIICTLPLRASCHHLHVAYERCPSPTCFPQAISVTCMLPVSDAHHLHAAVESASPLPTCCHWELIAIACMLLLRVHCCIAQDGIPKYMSAWGGQPQLLKWMTLPSFIKHGQFNFRQPFGLRSLTTALL